VVSQNFDMGDWEPDSVATVHGRNFAETLVHLWVIPADVAGTWSVALEDGSGPTQFDLSLTQRYQRVTGSLEATGRLRGNRLVLTLRRAGKSLTLDGRVEGDTMTGSQGRWKATRPPRPEARRP
jgi:hypothetical protein